MATVKRGRPKGSGEKLTAINIRVPRDIGDELHKLAVIEMRSVASMAAILLREAIAERKEKAYGN